MGICGGGAERTVLGSTSVVPFGAAVCFAIVAMLAVVARVAAPHINVCVTSAAVPPANPAGFMDQRDTAHAKELTIG